MEPAINSDMTRETTGAYPWEYQSVAPTVGGMSAQRLAYDDLSSPAEMSADCRAVAAALRRPAPSIRYEDHPREVPEPGIEIPVATARLAAALNLQVDGD
jgi:hypothetical protein